MFKAPNYISALTAAAILSVAGFTIPAQAAEANEKPVTLKKEERNGVTVYCTKYSATGSRVARDICLTKSEWNSRGATINDVSDVVAASKDSADRS